MRLRHVALVLTSTLLMAWGPDKLLSDQYSPNRGDADKILDYFGGSPCIHTKTAFGRSSCT
jgi:hypothetical protein